jgi:hypothetical protein
MQGVGNGIALLEINDKRVRTRLKGIASQCFSGAIFEVVSGLIYYKPHSLVFQLNKFHYMF